VKRFFLILIFFLACFTSMAQKVALKNLTTFDDKRLHFGFTIGMNTADFSIEHYNVMSENPVFMQSNNSVDQQYKNDTIRADIAHINPGFTVGMVMNLRLSEDFDLRFLPGMSFAERKLTYNIPIVDITSDVTEQDSYSIKSTFLDFPLLVKYKAKRMNNLKPYIIGGVASRIDISKTGQEDLVRLKARNPSIEAGFGWDTYLQFFRLSTEFKFSFGLRNILDSGPKETQPQVYTGALSSLKSNMFTLSFHFE
jgi:hypothetical protein